jgi:hypothetical protein
LIGVVLLSFFLRQISILCMFNSLLSEMCNMPFNCMTCNIYSIQLKTKMPVSVEFRLTHKSLNWANSGFIKRFLAFTNHEPIRTFISPSSSHFLIAIGAEKSRGQFNNGKLDNHITIKRNNTFPHQKGLRQLKISLTLFSATNVLRQAHTNGTILPTRILANCLSALLTEN